MKSHKSRSLDDNAETFIIIFLLF